MEPVKIRGTWRWVDANGVYRRGTDEEFYGTQQPVTVEPVVEEAPTIEEVYSDGLFDDGNE